MMGRRRRGLGLRASGFRKSVWLVSCALIAACRAEAADAGAGSAKSAAGLAIPAGWQAAPKIVEAMAGSNAVERPEAWAEPAMGCYAVAFAVPGGAPAEVAEQLTGALGSGTVARDVVAPGPDGGTMTFSFERGVYRGRVRAELQRVESAVVACFWNDREPAACEAACKTILGGAK